MPFFYLADYRLRRRTVRTRFTVAWLFVFLMLPTISVAQSQGGDAWSALQAFRPSQKVDVKLKDGKTTSGEFISVTDTVLTLSRNGKTIDVKNADALRIYRVSSKHVGKSTLIGTAVGAGAGAVAGAAWKNCPLLGPPSSCSRMTADGVLAGATLFAIPGAAVGLILGLVRENRELLYEATTK
jgi:hypothetical protein